MAGAVRAALPQRGRAGPPRACRGARRHRRHHARDRRQSGRRLDDAARGRLVADRRQCLSGADAGIRRATSAMATPASITACCWRPTLPGALVAGFVLEMPRLLQARPNAPSCCDAVVLRAWPASRCRTIYLLSLALLVRRRLSRICPSTRWRRRWSRCTRRTTSAAASSACTTRARTAARLLRRHRRRSRQPDRRSLVAGAQRDRAARGHDRPARLHGAHARSGTGAVTRFPHRGKSGRLHHHQSKSRRLPAGRTHMFSKINHVAIVSENYAQLCAVLSGLFGMRTSDKTRPGSAVTVRRRLCRAQHQSAPRRAYSRARSFRHRGRGRRNRL